MKLNFRNILTASAVLLAAAACSKDPEQNTPVNSPITLKATEAGVTKALLDNGTFKATGNRIQVYDFVDNNTTPHIDAYAGPDVESNSPLHQYGKTWPFEDKETGNPTTYQWIPGTHKFFGWLAKDANGTKDNVNDDMTPSTLFGSTFTFDNNTKTLTIPTTTIDHNTPQFDFMYSDINVTEPTNDAVAMEFYHLFTAVSIGVENSTSSIISINKFRLEGIPCRRSATINFSGSNDVGKQNPDVEYSEWVVGATFTRNLDAKLALPLNIPQKTTFNNVFTGSLGEKEYMMLWPVDATDLHSTETTTTEEGVVKYPDSWKIYIEYTADGQSYTKRINLPDMSWEAGKKTHLTIVFADKMVELTAVVNDWEYEEQEIDYSTEAAEVAEKGTLKWSSDFSTVDDTKKMVSIVNAQPAQGMFTLVAPIGGSWIASLTGDVNAFEISPSTGIIDSQTATVHLKPLIASPTRDYKVQVKFTIRRSDGRMIAADDLIQRNGVYTIVLPRNN